MRSALPQPTPDRIVIVPTPYGPPWREGVANLARRLVDALTAGGEKVRVLTPDRGYESGAGEFGEEVVALTPGGRGTRARLRFWRRIARELLRTRRQRVPALVFASLSDSSPLRLAILNAAAGGKLLTYVTGLASDRPRRLPQRFTPRPVAVLSSFLNRWLPDAPVIGPFLPVTFTRRPEPPTFPGPDKPFRFLFLGAYEPGRGVEDLLEAFRETRLRAGRPVALTVAINGSNGRTHADLHAWAGSRGLTEGVTFEGVVDPLSEYEAAHAVVIPRASERRMAFPVRILEAAYCRRPVVTTTACAMDRLIAGLESPPAPGDFGQLARAMTDLAQVGARYRAMMEGTAATFERFDPDRSLATLIELWKQHD